MESDSRLAGLLKTLFVPNFAHRVTNLREILEKTGILSAEIESAINAV